MIGRKLRLLGYDPGDAELVECARSVELRLDRLVRECLLAEQEMAEVADRSSLPARISRVRRAASSFLAAEVGTLARGVAAWPRSREALLRAVADGESLEAEARGALALLPRLGALRVRAAELEARFAATLPRRWALYTGDLGLTAHLEMAADAAMLDAVEGAVDEAEAALQGHMDMLLKLERELRNALGERTPRDGIPSSPCVETRVVALVAAAAELARRGIAESRMRVDDQVVRHLEHLGQRSESDLLAHETPGSFAHAMARLAQLRGAQPEP